MTQMITTGTWVVDETKEGAFLEAWAAFAAAASTSDGATTLRLGRDPGDPRRFVSFAAWDSAEAVHAWRSSPDMEEGLAQVLQHVGDFHNEVLEVMVTATGGLSQDGNTHTSAKGA